MKLLFPEGKRYAICLTFDFDAIALWIGSFGLKTPGYLSRGEFGVRVGVPRILSLLDKYGIKSTWFVPGHTAETFPQQVKEVFKRGHEIAHHGYLHENISRLSLEEECEVIQRGLKALERTVGQRPYGFRSPSWEFSDNTIKILLKNGFKYDSSLMADDFKPYLCREGDQIDKDGRLVFGKETKLIEFPVSWSMDDWPHFEFLQTQLGLYQGLRSIEDVFENWRADFDYMVSNLEWGVYTLTFHPQVIGRGHRMVLLENMINYFRKFNTVFFARLIDVAKCIHQQLECGN